MRRLTKKQETELTKLVEAGHNTILSIYPSEDYLRIESYNEYETFHQDADRFMNDKFFELQMKKPSLGNLF